MAYNGMTEEQAARITDPCFLIVGDRDELITIEGVVELYRWLPNAELAVLPGAAHMGPMADPELFVCLLLDFLQRH